MSRAAIRRFVAGLRAADPGVDCVNPYAGHVAGLDLGADPAAVRARQLAAYLDMRLSSARLLLIAEAPGYQGARFTGIAMTCERLLLGHDPRVAPAGILGPRRARRTSDPAHTTVRSTQLGGYAEPTSSVVWQSLAARPGAGAAVVLWNVFPFHPHRAGEPLSNRLPTRRELAEHAGHLPAFLALFPGARIVAVGRTAERHLARLGHRATAIRHPSRGGAGAFRTGLALALDATGL